MSRADTSHYKDALHRLLQLVDYERMTSLSRERVRFDLSGMKTLLRSLGDPHLGTPTVHIAGTRGKGSTAALCASALSRQGYRTGLYTSPHLHSFRERIRLNGHPVSEEEFAGLVDTLWPHVESGSGTEGPGGVTMFEALTAMAFCHFSQEADFQVLEVGLGGRLDTTNVADPDVCAITSLSLDHTSILGNTIESIAREKAGIIKPGVAVVTSPQVPEAMAVLESTCKERGAPLIKVREDITWQGGDRTPQGQSVEVTGRLGAHPLWIPLLGEHQLENAATAVGILEVLKEKGFELSDGALDQGFRQVSWPCRMEVLGKSPLVVCDGAHNPYSAARLRDAIPAYFSYRRVILVAGASLDKNLEGIVKELAVISPSVIVTRSRHPRAAPTEVLAAAFAERDLEVSLVEGVDRALTEALQRAGDGDLVLITGSLFVAAESREAALGIEPELYPDLHEGHTGDRAQRMAHG